MSEASVEIRIGEITFSGQGESAWLAEQLDKILDRAADLLTVAPQQPTNGAATKEERHQPMATDEAIAKKTLPGFLKEKNAKSQVDKFLVTAVWLEAKGQNRMTTADVSKALKDSNQSRLSNPSDCLNQNVGKGYCEKDGRQFFVTQDGKDSL